jgi:hypothetical protein
MTVARQLMHMRQVDMTAFLRDDGLWDLEVALNDRKTHTFPGGAGDQFAGALIHGMALALTVDTQGTVVAATADMKAVPFDGSCQPAAQEYQLLVGLNLFNGFRVKLRERIGTRHRCSHLSEMAQMLPTLAVQAFAGAVHPVRDDGTQSTRPAPLDGCRGLRIDGEAVRLFFPRWFEKPAE